MNEGEFKSNKQLFDLTIFKIVSLELCLLFEQWIVGSLFLCLKSFTHHLENESQSSTDAHWFAEAKLEILWKKAAEVLVDDNKQPNRTKWLPRTW